MLIDINKEANRRNNLVREGTSDDYEELSGGTEEIISPSRTPNDTDDPYDLDLNLVVDLEGSAPSSQHTPTSSPVSSSSSYEDVEDSEFSSTETC